MVNTGENDSSDVGMGEMGWPSTTSSPAASLSRLTLKRSWSPRTRASSTPTISDDSGGETEGFSGDSRKDQPPKRAKADEPSARPISRNCPRRSAAFAPSAADAEALPHDFPYGRHPLYRDVGVSTENGPALPPTSKGSSCSSTITGNEALTEQGPPAGDRGSIQLVRAFTNPCGAVAHGSS